MEHTQRLASGFKADLSDPSKLGANSDGLLRAHGIIMILCWMAAASTGMFFARYVHSFSDNDMVYHCFCV